MSVVAKARLTNFVELPIPIYRADASKPGREATLEISPAHRAGYSFNHEIRPEGTVEFSSVPSGRKLFLTLTRDSVPG
jgi:hypothetical protein